MQQVNTSGASLPFFTPDVVFRTQLLMDVPWVLLWLPHILDWGVFGSSLYLQSVETTITFSSGATAIHLNCVLQPALTNGMANCERLCTPFTYGVLVETVSCLHFTHNHNLNDILLFLPIARIFLLEESMLVYEE